MPAYQFRLADGGGTYITDARTVEDAQAELTAHFLRPVMVCVRIDQDGSHNLPSAPHAPPTDRIDVAGSDSPRF